VPSTHLYSGEEFKTVSSVIPTQTLLTLEAVKGSKTRSRFIREAIEQAVALAVAEREELAGEESAA
jgi:metal-responsive CopG/Arc/MetJ family transcriptional regulator